MKKNMAFSWKVAKKNAIRKMEVRKRIMLKLGFTIDANENEHVIKRLKKELGLS